MLISLKAAMLRLINKIEPYVKTDLSYFVKSGFWLNLNSGAGMIIAFILSILFAHFLSKDTYGIYRYILSIAGIASAFSLTGMNVAVMRAVAQGFDRVFLRSLIEQIKWSWPQFLFSFVAGCYYFYHGNSIYGWAFLIVSILAPISTIANTYSAVLTGKKDFQRSAKYGISSNLIYLVAMSAAIIGAPYHVIVLITAYYGANALSNAFFCWRTYRIHFHKGSIAPTMPDYRPEDISYAKHLSLMGIIGILATQADSILVYYFLGPVSLALYSFATIIPERIRVLFGFISSAAFPRIAEKDLESIRPNLARKTWQLIGLALLMSAAYIIAAPFIFRIFFPQYESVVFYSQVFSLSLVAIATNISFTALLAQRQQQELYYLSFGVPIAKIVMTIVGIYYLGIWGAIGAKMLSHVVLLASSSYYLHRKK